MSSFGGAYGKTTSDYVNEAKDAIVTTVEALPEITIKDEDDELDSKYEQIYGDVVKYTTPIIKALNGLPVYYRYHIKNGLALGKGPKIAHYKDFTKKRKQSQKRKETKRNEGRVNKKRRVEKVEDVDEVYSPLPSIIYDYDPDHYKPWGGAWSRRYKEEWCKRHAGQVEDVEKVKRSLNIVEKVEVNKKRRVEDVEKLEDVFASFNIEDDDVPHRQYIETHGVVHPDVQ
jgi:hypothetical protein